MKRNTIKWRLFKYNLIVIILLIALVTVIFNVAVRIYIENDITGQLSNIASRTEDTALRRGPDFFQGPNDKAPPPHNERNNNSQGNNNQNTGTGNDDIYKYYFELDRSLRQPLSMLNADYILLDSNKDVVNPSQDRYFNTSSDLLNKINDIITKSKNLSEESYSNFSISGTEYIAIIKPVYQKNTFGLGWIVIYSSLQKINQLQAGINIILFGILIFSALVMMIFSSRVTKKISAPFSSLNRHLGAIAERNFGTKLQIPVDDELQEFVNNINALSEKLEEYDKAQKTFLQNASHEFRTPLMSIQSYAEGIKYEVVDSATAADIIIDETRRMTHLVEDLLYLSRLDTIEENYHFVNLDFNELVKSCIDRLNGIAAKNNILISANIANKKIIFHGDEEKLSRAIMNIISNCIRYANSCITISSKVVNHDRLKLTISDDGPGFENDEISNIFERFYKGKKGNTGLGLAISKNVVEKHNGKITAENSSSGALFTIEFPLDTFQ